ncbi:MULTISPECIES: glyoxalase superfamily protein [unclassified Beijerinckia]|uniref:glyoxalase superfamily protein n=1 Tax=unclassified Beijerinckia TaxID=2638183 RepID=UPI00089D192D|nr:MULTISPECIES: glyoxalase superfamily protein [unclassified Beijerinckia]MDH7795375.1 hypothetical protein [Beijerinckia sp. GAS462]SEB98973.1 Clp amino terminal domain-containing protein, pathogenicity island component [Beijerinckia sp. 28-YEA-48]
MRDFRNAKAMAQTLRSALAAKGLKITHSQSLELIAETFGVADWNTLAAMIHSEPTAVRNNVPSPLRLAIGSDPEVPLSATLSSTLQKTFVFASRRKHEYATLEHLLLGLIDDADAAALMSVGNVDYGVLSEKLTGYLDNDLKKLMVGGIAAPKPTAAFQRVIQRGSLRAQELERPLLTGAHILEALFTETQSPAVRFLGEQGMTQQRLSEIIAPEP